MPKGKRVKAKRKKRHLKPMSDIQQDIKIEVSC